MQTHRSVEEYRVSRLAGYLASMLQPPRREHLQRLLVLHGYRRCLEAFSVAEMSGLQIYLVEQGELQADRA